MVFVYSEALNPIEISNVDLGNKKKRRENREERKLVAVYLYINSILYPH